MSASPRAQTVNRDSRLRAKETVLRTSHAIKPTPHAGRDSSRGVGGLGRIGVFLVALAASTSAALAGAEAPASNDSRIDAQDIYDTSYEIAARAGELLALATEARQRVVPGWERTATLGELTDSLYELSKLAGAHAATALSNLVDHEDPIGALSELALAPLFANARGQFWLAVVPPGAPCADCLNPPDILISDPISNLLDPLTATWSFPNMIRGKWGTMWSLAAGDPGVALPASAGSGVVLLEDLHLGAMKGAWVEHLAPNAAGTRPDRDLRFVPLADGSLNHDLHDGNDFRVMEWGVCQSIQDDFVCGRPISTMWGY